MHDLARALLQQHHDRWLADFLSAGRSKAATIALVEAANANHDGDLDNALTDTTRAISLLGQRPTDPVALRARLERIYSLRRQSKGSECATDSADLSRYSSRLGYKWLATQSLIEKSSCQAMIGDFDAAWRTASEARSAADNAGYASLLLRAIALQAALDNNEGRIDRAWHLTIDGLRSFCSNPFPNERGFQFYSELEFSAEQVGQWQLAAELQKEAIALIHPLHRPDFEATAHFHLAAVEEVLGDAQQARREIGKAGKCFAMLSAGQSRQFLQTESKIALGSLEARFGSPQVASVQLSGLEQVVDKTQNFTVQLSYERAEAALQRRLGNKRQEIIHLRRCIEIGEKGYNSLYTTADRWDWERTTGTAYRRLIEMHLSGAHIPLQTLAEWETYRASATGKQRILPLKIRILQARAAILAREKQLGPSTAIVYARFPQFIVAWVLNRHGIEEFKLGGGPEVDRLVKTFHFLCSDPTSSVQKVKADGLRLYQILLSPIEEHGHLKGTVRIEADGSLGMIPWLALTSKDGSYLGARLSIVNTSLAMHAVARVKTSNVDRLLVAYPGAISLGRTEYLPLKDAAAEANDLAEKSKEAIFLRGSEVTTTNLTADLPRVSVFHFAGHAVTRESGGELLVQGSREGELFSSAAISRLDLTDLRLAVLAACDTGTSWDAAKNPNGLVGAFLTAGTHRVVGSLWAVDSNSSSLLLSRFYRKLDLDSKQAVEQAWQHAIGPELAKHPYYWAGFQVFGN